MAEPDAQNQIVVYQPNETVRLDVRLRNETVWQVQSQMVAFVVGGRKRERHV